MDDVRVSEDNLRGALSLEVLGTELCELHELFEGVLLEDGYKWCLLFNIEYRVLDAKEN